MNRLIAPALAALCLIAAAPAAAAAAPTNPYADLAEQVAGRWADQQNPDGSFPNPAGWELELGHGGFTPPPMLYGIHRAGQRAGDPALVGAAARVWRWPVNVKSASTFDIAAAAYALRDLDLAAADRVFLRSYVGAYTVSPNGDGCITVAACYHNLKLVDAVAILAALDQRVTAATPNSRLADPDAARRAAARVINEQIPRVVDHRVRGVLNGEPLRATVLSDPDSNPLAYHALSAFYLGEAVKLLGNRTSPRARRALAGALDALSVMTSPDGDLSYMGRGQGQAWVPALTAAAMVNGAAQTQHTDPQRAARYLAVADRAVDRLRRLHLSPLGLRVVPGTRTSVAGQDRYVHTTAYNGLALFALTVAADTYDTLSRPTLGAVPAERHLTVVDPHATGLAVSSRRGVWMAAHAFSRLRGDLRHDFGLLALKTRRRDGTWRDLLAPRPLTHNMPELRSAGPVLVTREGRALPSGRQITATANGEIVIGGGFQSQRRAWVRSGVTFRLRPISGGASVTVSPVRAGDRYELLLFTAAGSGSVRGRTVIAYGTRVTFDRPVKVTRERGWHSGPVEQLDALRVSVPIARDGTLRLRLGG